METIIIQSENTELLSKIKNYITALKVNFEVLNTSNHKDNENYLVANNLQKFSNYDLIQRIEKSELDYKNGCVLTQSELIENSKNW
jgi:hypothetical protein